MSSTIQINDVTLVTTKEAARAFRYSHDYIGKLAREGRIVATQIGRQWFVDPVSVRRFVESAEVEKVVRRRQLREERAIEQRVHAARAALAARAAHAQTGTSALVQAALVLCLGFVVGGSFLVVDQSVTRLLGTEPLTPIAGQLAQLRVGAPAPAAPQSAATSPAPASAAAAPVRHAVVLLPARGGATSTALVEALFSDEVVIEYADDRTGTVTPRFRDGDGRGVPFIEVPVNEVSE